MVLVTIPEWTRNAYRGIAWHAFAIVIVKSSSLWLVEVRRSDNVAFGDVIPSTVRW